MDGSPPLRLGRIRAILSGTRAQSTGQLVKRACTSWLTAHAPAAENRVAAEAARRNDTRRSVMGAGRKPARASDVSWDDTFDVVVVGAGAAGFPAALNAAAHGANVVILEKATEPGGTMKKSAAWYWIPNNTSMRDDGLVDERDDFVRYCARLARPHAFDASADDYGLSA